MIVDDYIIIEKKIIIDHGFWDSSQFLYILSIFLDKPDKNDVLWLSW